jgi:hypothetical protein
MKLQVNKLYSFIAFSFFLLFLLPPKVHAQETQPNQSQAPLSLSQSTIMDQTKYTVQYGDSLSSIAKNSFGDGDKWIDIYNLNKSMISDPNEIYSGEVILLPTYTQYITVSDTSSDQDEKTVSESINSAPVPLVPQVNPSVISSNKNILKQVSSSNLVGASNYSQMIDAAASQYGVSSSLMNKIIACESGYNPNAHNPSGATGIAQFMPSTFYASWNPYKGEGIYSAHAQIYAMALKISQGGVSAWVCSGI